MLKVRRVDGDASLPVEHELVQQRLLHHRCRRAVAVEAYARKDTTLAAGMRRCAVYSELCVSSSEYGGVRFLPSAGWSARMRIPLLGADAEVAAGGVVAAVAVEDRVA